MRLKIQSCARVACGMVLLFGVAARAQKLPTLPTPVDRSTARFRPDTAHISPDGSKFVLLVELQPGGTVLKYVALRQDLADQINQLISDLDTENPATRSDDDALSTTISSRQQEVDQLQATKDKLLDALATSEENEARLRRQAGSSTTTTTTATAAPTPPVTPSDVTLTARYRYKGPATAEDFVAENDPNIQGLLSLPINPATFRLGFDPTTADQPDGTRLRLVSDAGGVRLRYVALREDYARFVRDQLDRRLYLKAQLGLLADNRNGQIKLLEEKKGILTADVSDLTRALQKSRENVGTLAALLKTQKRKPLERFIDALPSIAGIIAVALSK